MKESLPYRVLSLGSTVDGVSVTLRRERPRDNRTIPGQGDITIDSACRKSWHVGDKVLVTFEVQPE